MKVSLGENSKLVVNPSERDQIRKFYQDVLGCPVTKESERIDIFKIGSTFYLGVMYGDSALSKEDYLKSIWLELRTENPDELKNKILDFGITEIEYWDKEHFYFQAPGGQVFRLTDSKEDMSKWQH
jgi:catechol 2,3-dioxygenase-like lactoylglutathione lyase family enzyme